MKYGSWGIVTLIIVVCSFDLQATDVISSAQAHAVSLQSDGKVVVAGTVQVNNTNKIVLNRYNQDGSFDGGFGLQGMVVTAIGNDAHAVGLHLTDTHIFVCGYALIENMTNSIILRYTNAGILDTSFADAGSFGFLSGNGCAFHACKQQSNGRLICVGSAVVEGVSKILLVALTDSGALDTDFGTNGVMLIEIASGATAQALEITESDEIIIAGYARRWQAWQPLLVKCTSQGVLNNTFGVDGISWIEIGTDAGISDMVSDSQNGIVATGFVDDQLLLCRLTSDGQLDGSFGQGGIVQKVWGLSAQGIGLALMSNESVAVIAKSDLNTVITKYSNQGILDTSFGDNGSVVLVLSEAADLVVQDDNKIVAAAFNDTDIIVARYLTNGNLDVSWGTLGLVNDPGGISTTVPVFITDTKSIGSNGGTFSSGAWQVRDLNTISSINNTITIAHNQIIIQPGSYTLRISAPAYRVGLHQVRLFNVTDNQPMAYGASAIASSNGSITFSTLETNITVTKVTYLQVEHRCTTTEQYDGFGIAGGFGDEVYTTVKITRI